LKATDYRKDLKSLLCNWSFVLSTLGFTCVTFCTGALAWWGPKFIEDALYSMELPVEERPVSADR
jgi:MFS transporter, Spinster family, sphingosine-1-phosphate transporter